MEVKFQQKMEVPEVTTMVVQFFKNGFFKATSMAVQNPDGEIWGLILSSLRHTQSRSSGFMPPHSPPPSPMHRSSEIESTKSGRVPKSARDGGDVMHAPPRVWFLMGILEILFLMGFVKDRTKFETRKKTTRDCKGERAEKITTES